MGWLLSLYSHFFIISFLYISKLAKPTILPLSAVCLFLLTTIACALLSLECTQPLTRKLPSLIAKVLAEVRSLELTEHFLIKTMF